MVRHHGRTRGSTSVLALALVACASLASCSRDVTSSTPGPNPRSGPSAVRLVPWANESASLAALGWAPGIRSADLLVTRTNDSTVQRFKSDERGAVALPALAAGTYVIQATRWLAGDERTHLARDDDLLGFVGIDTVKIAARGDTVVARIGAVRRGSIVISEIQNLADIGCTLCPYEYAYFLKLYNNSDQPVYLDHLAIGMYEIPQVSVPAVYGCHDTARWTLDSAGVWARDYWEFPGSGTDYPVAPGRSVVVAEDAIDHTKFDPRGPDLSHADFETPGPAKASNPAVPQMIRHCTECRDLVGHGLRFYGAGQGFFVSRPLRLDTLHKQAVTIPPFWTDMRIDRGAILDHAESRDDGSDEYWMARGLQACEPFGNPWFDRSPARLFREVGEFGLTMQRRRLDAGSRFPPGILQRTSNSAYDFMKAPLTVGTSQR
ncbi:MAG TPA: hypothetical protein VHE78_01405 [Gemmatimonadaceae bacterium]|nr:hypothetical protein [Gemmatimonadaceae bacterium]